jgi:hypothetical protein
VYIAGIDFPSLDDDVVINKTSSGRKADMKSMIMTVEGKITGGPFRLPDPPAGSQVEIIPPSPLTRVATKFA